MNICSPILKCFELILTEKSDKHIDLILSLGLSQENDNNDGYPPISFDNLDDDKSFASDYSEHVQNYNVREEKSPQKLSELSDSA